MIKKLVFYFLIAITLIGCIKESYEKTTKEKIIGTWKFKETPDRLINSWGSGYYEDRTVFSGEEIISFNENGNFLIDSINYGFWYLDSVENIVINMTSSGGYADGYFIQTMLVFEIIELNDTILKVDHSFYKFYPNYYIFEPFNK